MNIEVKNAEMLGRTDSIYTIKFYVMQKQIDELQQKNQKLQERIEYLERSNNHREDTILEQRQEISDLADNWDKLKAFIVNEISEEEFINNEHYVSILDKIAELEKRCNL